MTSQQKRKDVYTLVYNNKITQSQNLNLQNVLQGVIMLKYSVLQFFLEKLFKTLKKQAGAELCQAQLSLKLASHKVGSS